jgi:putative membrane protein
MTTENPLKRGNWMALTVVVLVLAAVAVAVVAKTSREPLTDSQFAAKAAQGSLAEVQLGRLAAQKAQNETVRAFGRRMATDHTKSKAKLEKIAARQNINLPEDLDKDAKQTYEKLSKLSGPDFDRAYALDMLKDHKKDVAEFQKEASAGKNEAIRSFAAETLPTLQNHLKAAQEMKELLDRSVTAIPNLPK